MAKKKYDTAAANARVDAAFARLGIGQGGRPAAPVARPARGGSSTYSVGSRASKVDRKGLAALNANYEKKLAFDKKKEDAKNDDDSSWWQDVLSAVDLPADFVRQSIGSGTQAVSDIFGGEGDWKDYLQTGVNALSLGTAGGLVAAATDNNDFNKDFSEHKGMGSHLHDALKATGQDKGVLANEWLDRGLGFAGDVATDPLTYLAPEAKLAGGSKKIAGRFLEAGAKAAEDAGAHAAASGAEHAAVQAAKDAAKSSFETAAAKVLAKGKSSLAAEEKGLIGARGGIHLRVPGTGRIGRKLFNTSEELLPLGGADASAAVGRTTRAALDKAVPKSLKGFIAENLSGGDTALKAALKSGEADRAIPAFHTLRAKAVEALAQETHGNALTKEWKAITKGHNADDIFRAVEGDPEAVGRVGADKVAEVNSYFTARRQELLDAGVEVGLVDQYVPRQLTGEARDALHANEPVGARSGAFSANPAEAPRTLTPEKFGVQTQAEVRAQAEEWAHSQGLTNLFEQDPDKVMAAYIRSHAKRMSDLRLEAALQEKGVFGKAFTGADKTALDDAIREGTETRSKLDDVVAQRDDLVENQIPLADEEEWQQAATQTMLDKAKRGVKNAKVKVSRLDAKVAEHEAEKAALEAGLPPSPEAVLESAHDAARQILKEKGLTALPDPQGGTLVFAEGGVAGSSEALADIKRATGMDAKYELVGKDVALPTKGGRRVGDVYKVELSPLPKDRAISAVERAHAPLDTPEAVASAVEDTQKRIAELDQKIELAGSKRKTLLEEQKAHETKRAFYLDQAQRYPAGSPEQSVSALQAQAEGLEADLATLRTQYRTQQETVAALSDKADQAAKIVKDGAHKLIGNASTAPPELVEALSQVTKVATKEGVRDFLKYYDKALNYIKAWQLTSPGFHVRNMMGGMFNNYLAGVEMGSYRAWKKIAAEVDAAEAAGHALTAEQARAKQLMELIGYRKSPLEAGQYGAGEIGLADLGKEPSKLAKRNPLGTQGPIVGTSQKFGRDVEWHLRGALGWDRLVKGESLESAISDINKYHFDYQDLSQFERSVAKRVIPFYTWTRRNVPLQFQMLVEKPAAYSHYFQAMNELQSGSTPEGVVPQYFSDLFATPIGNQTIQGDRAYAVPDLPLTRTMTEALPTSLDPKENFNKYLSQVTPLLKTPVELYTGKQAFKDIPLSEKWVSPPIIGSVPGLSDVLKASGLLNEKGQIRSKWAYAIEQAMPAYGRIRRLAPTEEKYKNRLLASYLSFAGIPIRTNTPEEKADELKRRSFEKKAAAKKKKSKKSAFSIY